MQSKPHDSPEPTPQQRESTTVRQLRQSERDAVSSEERYRLLVDNVEDYAIFLLGPEGHIQSWNRGAERIKGYSAEEIIGKHFSIFYTPEDLERDHPAHELEIAKATGRFQEEGWRLRKDGTRFWANILITRLTDPEGRLLGFGKVTRDLTQRRLAEEELRASEERFRLLVSSVKDYAIFMLNPKGIVETWNEGAQRIKGYLPKEIIGQHFSRFYTDEDIRIRKPWWELEEATLTGRFEDEGWRLRKDGTRFWANVVITAMRNADGRLMGFAKITRDMTDRRRLEEKLRRSNEEMDKRVQERTEQLERAIRTRDEFISIVSHELRTPVTSLKLQVQMAARMLDRNDPVIFHERTVKFVTGAERHLDRLTKLIDDMLDVSRISMDRLAMETEELPLDEAVRETVERFEEQCKSAGCELSIPRMDAVSVIGDRARLEQVISNLIMNAIKHGAGRPISVSVIKSGSDAMVQVHDQGIGIAPADHERIFERFERAIAATSVSGMGLGLYISRKIVEAHGGRITVQSDHGIGSTFTVTLPAMEPVGSA